MVIGAFVGIAFATHQAVGAILLVNPAALVGVTFMLAGVGLTSPRRRLLWEPRIVQVMGVPILLAITGLVASAGIERTAIPLTWGALLLVPWWMAFITGNSLHHLKMSTPNFRVAANFWKVLAISLLAAICMFTFTLPAVTCPVL